MPECTVAFFYGDSDDLYAIFKKIITIDAIAFHCYRTCCEKIGALKKGNKWEYKVIFWRYLVAGACTIFNGMIFKKFMMQRQYNHFGHRYIFYYKLHCLYPLSTYSMEWTWISETDSKKYLDKKAHVIFKSYVFISSCPTFFCMF